MTVTRWNPSIERSLDQDTHPFGGSPSFTNGTGTSIKNILKNLQVKDLKILLTWLKRYHGVENIDMGMMQQMMQIMQEVGSIEQDKKEQLEQLAIDIVSEEFDIPEDMLKPDLVPPGAPLDIE